MDALLFLSELLITRACRGRGERMDMGGRRKERERGREGRERREERKEERWGQGRESKERGEGTWVEGEKKG